uniref:M132L n=1 Tax=Strongyloides papillosus TaxID=174720 RepID=A0A0N5BD50_STREA
MHVQGSNTMDSSGHMRHIYYGETLSLVIKILAIVGLIGTMIFIIRCCLAYHKLQKRSSRSNYIQLPAIRKTDVGNSNNDGIIREIRNSNGEIINFLHSYARNNDLSGMI